MVRGSLIILFQYSKDSATILSVCVDCDSVSTSSSVNYAFLQNKCRIFIRNQSLNTGRDTEKPLNTYLFQYSDKSVDNSNPFFFSRCLN